MSDSMHIIRRGARALKHRNRVAVVARALVLPFVLASCSWFTDFKQQPKIDPWESPADTIPPRGNPQNSVSVYGTVAPGYEYSRMAAPAAVSAMSDIPNPVAPDAASLERGRKIFQIDCSACHGPKGDGMSQVMKYGFPAISLLTESARGRTDGYIFGMIRNGRGVMPTYNRIEEPDRWDVVNYIRGLQGKLGVAVIAEPLAPPGITGSAVPGVTQMGPTRPAPYYKHIGSQAGVPLTTPGQPENTMSGTTAATPLAPPAPATGPVTPAPDSTRGGQP